MLMHSKTDKQTQMKTQKLCDSLPRTGNKPPAAFAMKRILDTGSGLGRC